MSWPKGKKRPPELVEKLAAANRGLKRTEAQKEQIRVRQTGRTMSPEAKEKSRISHNGQNNRKGYVQPEETKKKISAKLMGRKLPEKQVQGLRERPTSFETRQRMAAARNGDKSLWWQGGITPLVRAIRTCFKNRLWRSDVFTRDNFTCVLCGKSKCFVEADHYPESFSSIFHRNEIKTLEQALKCEEFWNINNGRTLCSECHNENKRRK
jgi:hypothetical protein